MPVEASQLFPNDTYTNSLSDTAAAIYDNPGKTLTRITGIAAHNYNTTVEVVTIYQVAPAGSAVDSNILTSFSVLPGTPMSWAYSKLIRAGYSLFAKSTTANKVNLWIDGTEETGARDS